MRALDVRTCKKQARARGLRTEGCSDSQKHTVVLLRARVVIKVIPPPMFSTAMESPLINAKAGVSKLQYKLGEVREC